LHELAAGRIEILPGGGIRPETAADVVKGSGCRQLHASFAETIPESSDRGRTGYPPRQRLSQQLVAATRAAVDQLV
jgi:copper homeostasis protein